MKKDIARANHYARMSCSKWNKPKTRAGRLFLGGFYSLKRYLNRRRYLTLVMNQCRPPLDFIEKHIILGEVNENTYPWPYCDPEFANWSEDDDEDDCSLVLDKSGCVVKHSTSYCAWKIFERTGRWPERRTNTRIDAREWRQFLSEAGYGVIVDSLELNYWHNYVGINPRYGEQGLVVWFEKEDDGYDSRRVWISTYRDREYAFEPIDADQYTWIQIC